MSDTEYREPRPSREAEEVYGRWIEFLDEEFTKHKRPSIRAELVRDNLHHLLLGRAPAGRLNFTLVSELPLNVLELALDPCNATLAAEYDPRIDVERYAPIKPLIWFWQMFDRTPLALNLWLGFRFRQMLGRHIFAQMGSNVRIYPGVEFAFGYHLTIEDDCVIQKGAMLDDRSPLTVRKGTTVAEHARVAARDAGGNEERLV